MGPAAPENNGIVAPRRLLGYGHLDFAVGHVVKIGEQVGQIAFAAGVPVHELVNDGGLLEDIFLELTSEAPA